MRSEHVIVMVAAVAVAENVCSDRMKHGSLWTSVVGRVGAVDGLLDHDSGARLHDQCSCNSRNTLLLNGESFSHAVFTVAQRTAAVVRL